MKYEIIYPDKKKTPIHFSLCWESKTSLLNLLRYISNPIFISLSIQININKTANNKLYTIAPLKVLNM